MPANSPLRLHDSPVPQQDASRTTVTTMEPLLVPAGVAGPLCGRSEASWWRDVASGRVPAPAAKFPGATLWSVAELREWVANSCPPRKVWDALKANRKG